MAFCFSGSLLRANFSIGSFLCLILFLFVANNFFFFLSPPTLTTTHLPTCSRSGYAIQGTRRVSTAHCELLRRCTFFRSRTTTSKRPADPATANSPDSRDIEISRPPPNTCKHTCRCKNVVNVFCHVFTFFNVFYFDRVFLIF